MDNICNGLVSVNRPSESVHHTILEAVHYKEQLKFISKESNKIELGTCCQIWRNTMLFPVFGIITEAVDQITALIFHYLA